MKTLMMMVCAALLLQGTPTLAANTPAPASKMETADSVKAAMKDETDKVKQQQKDQMGKLKAQQKEQRDKLKAEQKQQLVKLKVDQKARWQKFQAQLAINDSGSSTIKSGKATATANP